MRSPSGIQDPVPTEKVLAPGTFINLYTPNRDSTILNSIRCIQYLSIS